VYDMYSWDQPASPADGADGPARASEPTQATQPGPARTIEAVQVALDRRDNGGAASSQPS
jgi:hypothetical protein